MHLPITVHARRQGVRMIHSFQSRQLSQAQPCLITNASVEVLKGTGLGAHPGTGKAASGGGHKRGSRLVLAF